MARSTAYRPARKGNQPHRAVIRSLVQAVGRLFCKRRIIIISDRNTQHVPFAAKTQVLFVFAVLGFVVWAAFSSGSYMAAQQVIREKEQKLATFAQENERVEAEFSLLKQDLIRLADDSKGSSKDAQAVKEIAKHYTERHDLADTTSDTTSSKYDVVLNRIQFLENKVKDLQSTHDAMVADIRATTGGKIKDIERVLAKTGVDSQVLQRAAEAKRVQEEQRREKYGRTENSSAQADGQGGPFMPASTSSVLKEKETELYFNLRKLAALHDVVTALPYALPMAENDYIRQTSGFGTRVDPFRGVLGYHAGVDLAGESGTKVLASSSGRVEFAGWKTAYGNMVELKHDYGFSTRYGHMSRISVRPGQMVKKGQVIGIQGSTGRSTGEHVHYEVRYDDKPLNPNNFLKAGDDVRALD